MNRLAGKSALIFGADAITAGIATRFAQEGAKVKMLGKKAALDGLEMPDVEISTLRDGTPKAAGEAVHEALAGGALDVFVIGGGDVPKVPAYSTIEAVKPNVMTRRVSGDVGTTQAAIRAAGPALKEKGGSVIFLFNPAGLYSEGGWGDAPVSHHARRGLARALAMEWGEHQIRVNTLVTLARTPGFEKFHARNPQQVDWRISKTAMRRVGDPVKDIGGAAVFLASPDTRYLTGSMIFADGGAFLGLPVLEPSMPAA